MALERQQALLWLPKKTCELGGRTGSKMRCCCCGGSVEYSAYVLMGPTCQQAVNEHRLQTSAGAGSSSWLCQGTGSQTDIHPSAATRQCCSQHALPLPQGPRSTRSSSSPAQSQARRCQARTAPQAWACRSF